MAAQLPSQADKGRRALARRRSRRGRLQLHARVMSAAVRSCHCVLGRGSRHAAVGGRRGRRPLQLRVIMLARQDDFRSTNGYKSRYCSACAFHPFVHVHRARSAQTPFPDDAVIARSNVARISFKRCEVRTSTALLALLIAFE